MTHFTHVYPNNLFCSRLWIQYYKFCLKFCFVGDGNKKKREAKTDEGILYYPCHEIWNKFDHFEFHKTRKFTWVDNFFWL